MIGRRKLSRELPGLALLACVVAFNAVLLAPELRIARVPLNDLVLHRAAAERLAQSWERGEPFLDPWVSEWSLGYPLWRSYQPLPHVLTAAWLRISEPFADSAAAFAALQYLLLVLFPASTYAGARLLGLNPLGAGLAGVLVVMPGATGELGRYGLGYGSSVWRGSGLFTQLVALHFLVLSLGLIRVALDSGRYRALAAAGLAATALSHIVFGYVGFVSAFVLAVCGGKSERSRRLVRLGTIVALALLLLAWFIVPLLRMRQEVNHSRWEAAYKWDSFGAQYVLTQLATGQLLDGDRGPLLTLLVLAGAVVAVLRFRESLPQRLLALSVCWLVLFFGRPTWGHLLLLAGVPNDLPLHRLQGAFELAAVLLAASGVASVLSWARKDIAGLAALAVLAVVSVLIVMMGGERVRYLQQNARWGEDNLAAYARERDDLHGALHTVRQILAERPGRVSAGLAASWGGQFKIGTVPMYAFLTRAHLDQVSFLYHAMSLTSDVMVLRREADLAHDIAFGVRAVVAPADWEPPPGLQLRGRSGRFAVYEASPEGYFGLVDIGARYVAPLDTAYDLNAAWLQSTWLRQGVVVALDARGPTVPALDRWQPLPAIPASLTTARGRIVKETKVGERYRAWLRLERGCYAFVKLTWHPDLVATVDGAPAELLRVTPGFGAVHVPPGDHVVEVSYQPGASRLILCLLGGVFFLGSVLALRTRPVVAFEHDAVTRFAVAGERLRTPAVVTSAVFAVLVVLALRPLFRGQLIDGHDALEYPPRLVEMRQLLADRQIPPIWAPDLGAGHGQPLFEFAPPLLYLAASACAVMGLRLADALQVALALLFTAGACAMYRLARRAGGGDAAALGVVAAWLFAPYTALDLYVRAAFAEAAAVAMAPVALLGLVRAMDVASPIRIALGAAAIALIPLAHNGAALLLIPALALLALLRPRPRRVTGVITLALGLALSAFVWLPAFLEKGFVKTSLLRVGPLDWRWHAIAPLQLLWSPWGYGGSVPGPGDGMSFQLGPLLLLLAAAGLVLAWRPADTARRREIAAFAVVAGAGAWLATTWSAPLWARAEPLQYLVYPWRALLLAGLFLPLLCVGAFQRLSGRVCALVIALLVVVNLSHTNPKGFLTFDDEYYAPQAIAEKGLNTTTREEYEPRWVRQRPAYTSRHLVGDRAPIEVDVQAIRTAEQRFVVRSPVDQRIEAMTFYYPGWTVMVDGHDVPVAPVDVRGTLAFPLAAGAHAVVLELRPTGVRRAARIISVLTAGILLAGIAVAGVRSRRRK